MFYPIHMAREKKTASLNFKVKYLLFKLMLTGMDHISMFSKTTAHHMEVYPQRIRMVPPVFQYGNYHSFIGEIG